MWEDLIYSLLQNRPHLASFQRSLQNISQIIPSHYVLLSLENHGSQMTIYVSLVILGDFPPKNPCDERRRKGEVWSHTGWCLAI